MSARIVEIFSGKKPAAARSGIEQLSDREFEVFQLIGQGLASQEIATRLEHQREDRRCPSRKH